MKLKDVVNRLNVIGLEIYSYKLLLACDFSTIFINQNNCVQCYLVLAFYMQNLINNTSNFIYSFTKSLFDDKLSELSLSFSPM